MTFHTSYIIQSKSTGRFMLRKMGKKWNFPVNVNWDLSENDPKTEQYNLEGTFGSVTSLCRHMSKTVPNFDDAVITVAPSQKVVKVDHIWIDSEFNIEGCEWFDFTIFPVDCHSDVFKAFNDPLMIRVFYTEP